MGYYTYFLVGGMLITGTLNTLLNKIQDKQCVGNCDDPDPSKHQLFEQPVWQTLNMFIGEASCLLAFYFIQLSNKRRNANQGYEEIPDSSTPRAREEDVEGDDSSVVKKRLSSAQPSTEPLEGWKTLLMWLPTLCDICGTTLMNVGLIYISASIYQMLRGAVVLFAGVFSVVFLNRKLHLYQWFSLILVVLGVSIVGASSILFPDEGPGSHPAVNASFTGIFMVLFAQIFTASQFVIEEKVLHRYHIVPVKAVGLEGVFGIASLILGVPILYFLFGKGTNGYFDIPVGWNQIINHPPVLISGILIAFSIAFFNWFGLSVTRTISATSRSTIDTCRTLFIWMASLSLGWEQFRWLQVLGFVVLIYGTFLFNGVVSPPFCKWLSSQSDV
ncbi:integral membrane protein-like protein [Basidiobolus meristosporus CBS 931.73]|uniref:Integral membrane protein-like protein n=1 Tax=Basidiobolus meristosporus CBS 931.73 TaxID=1314790 RepID=A0A1Y1YX45_9FUNG|nr:integral membrane protein-like protein [Basidiobolus meristosporus CBS 931.73]|eukprot:ORY02633.1 integral membrane protein-like protein [Basidiobolus meristosporus CBS 931.73]